MVKWLMRNLKKILFILVFLLFVDAKGFCASRATQTLSISLPQVLSIDRIIVETNEYRRDEPMPNVKVENSQSVNANNTVLRLTPVKVQIHTNASSPINISALFKELKHKDGKYDFNPNYLSVEPSSYTINNPYDGIITDYFTPVVDVKPDTVIGVYRGSLFFTLGAI